MGSNCSREHGTAGPYSLLALWQDAVGPKLADVHGPASKWVANSMPELTETASRDQPVTVSAAPPVNRGAKDALAFNPQLTCLEPWFDQLIDAVVDEVEALPGNPTVKDAHKRCLRPILANLCKAQRSKKSLSVARDKNAYGLPKPYNPARLTHPKVIFCLDHLEASGLIITVKKGSYDRTTGRGQRTRIRGTPKLRELIDRFCPSGAVIEIHPMTEGIRLKNANKKLITYPETTATRRMRSRLEKINKQIATSSIALPGASAVPFHERRLYRVFNNSSFEKGGRFYGGWWQELPEARRKDILINGKPVIERDFSGMHVKMLYATEASIDYREDPYLLAGFGQQWRDAFKKVLLICLSAKSKRAALAAIQSDRLDNPSRYPAHFVPKDALDAFLKKHHRISSAFFDPELGLKLQYQDSQIAEQIMLELGKHGIVALPIHDSFIVAEVHDGLLRATMERVFQERLGVTPTVKHFLSWVGEQF